jgi:RNA polymerase sigma-70 factor (ECF subfamily)
MIQKKHLEQFILLQTEYTDGTTEQINTKQTAEKIQSAIDRLSPQCRQAFILSRYEHLPYKDIASQMGISVNTVEKHLGKALMLLRLEFREYHLPILLLIGLIEMALKH